MDRMIADRLRYIEEAPMVIIRDDHHKCRCECISFLQPQRCTGDSPDGLEMNPLKCPVMSLFLLCEKIIPKGSGVGVCRIALKTTQLSTDTYGTQQTILCPRRKIAGEEGEVNEV